MSSLFPAPEPIGTCQSCHLSIYRHEEDVMRMFHAKCLPVLHDTSEATEYRTPTGGVIRVGKKPTGHKPTCRCGPCRKKKART